MNGSTTWVTGCGLLAATTAEVSDMPSKARLALLVLIVVVASGCGDTSDSEAELPAPLAAFRDAAVEHTDRLRPCLEDGGALVDTISPVELAIEPGPALNEEAMAALVNRCRDEAGPPPPRPTDRESIAAIYAGAAEVSDGLREHGYVPTDPPSFETFLDGYANSGGVAWTPYDGVDRLPPEEFNEAKRLCPEWTG